MYIWLSKITAMTNTATAAQQQTQNNARFLNNHARGKASRKTTHVFCWRSWVKNVYIVIHWAKNMQIRMRLRSEISHIRTQYKFFAHMCTAMYARNCELILNTCVRLEPMPIYTTHCGAVISPTKATLVYRKNTHSRADNVNNCGICIQSIPTSGLHTTTREICTSRISISMLLCMHMNNMRTHTYMCHI